VHAEGYGLMPADDPARPASRAGNRAAGRAWPVRSGRVPPVADGFIARTETVPGLAGALVPGAAVALVTARQAPGSPPDWPGACGKTQLAADVSGSLWRSRTVGLVAWVTATSRASVLCGYAQAAAQLGLDHGRDAEAVASRFGAWLAGTSRPWLVVLDDLRDGADLDGLWPAGPAGRVLVTAADAAAVPGEHRVLVVEVPAFSTREALNYLMGRLSADPDQRSGAIELVGELGGEPAALAHASAVLVSSGLRCGEYREYFARRRAQLAAGGGPVPAGAVTWTLAAEYAARLAPGGGTWPVLALAAVVDGHAVPGTVFTTPATCQYLADAAGLAGPADAWPAVMALERAGLVAVDAAGSSPAVWVSQALQAAVRAAAPPQLLDRAVRAAANAVVQAAHGHQATSWPAAALRSCAVSLRRAAGDVLWDGGGCHRLLLRAGQSLDAAGLTGPAVTWWRELAADSSRLLGLAHPDTIAAGALLADALLAAGQAAEAETWFRWVAAGRAGVLGPDHPATIAAEVSLGRALAAAGQPGEAIAVLAEAARHGERVHGPDDPGTWAAWDQQAAAFLVAGQAAQAIGCCQRSLAGRERRHGPHDPATVEARLRLAGALLAAGKTKDAIAEHKQVLAGREHTLGADHPGTLAARAALAAALDAAGQMAAALAQHQETCAGYERVFGGDHPDTLARRADLARAYAAAGQLGEAVGLLREAIARSEQVLSLGDALTRALRQALADVTGQMTTG